MHPSSLDNMEKCKGYLQHITKDLGTDLDILDVGGRQIPGKESERSYRKIFEDVTKNYYICDIAEGPNVTHLMTGEYEFPFEDNSIDLIVCGQVLEHVKNPFKSVAEMKRVLKPDHYMILIAPSTGKRHDSIDCWRFMDDSFKAIAEDVGLKVVVDYIDKTAPDQRSARWQDHVFIGKKNESN